QLYTLSLHDALPISARRGAAAEHRDGRDQERAGGDGLRPQIRRDLPSPRPRQVRHVVDGTGERAVTLVLLDSGDHPHEVELTLVPFRPEVAVRRRLALG